MQRNPKLDLPFSVFTPMPNPFLAPPVADAVADDAPEGSYTYTLVKSAPDLAPDEVELHAASVELVIRWGGSVLHVAHLTPPRSFYVGEEERKNLACDYFLPAEQLGLSRTPVVLVEHGVVRVVLLAHAKGSVTLAGRPSATLAELIASGAAEPCAEVTGAHAIALPMGSRATIEVGGVVFDIGTVNAGRAVASGPVLDTKALPYTALSFMAHAAILGAMAFFMPPLGLTDDGDVSSDQRYAIAHALSAMAEKELDQRDTPDVADSEPKSTDGGTGARAKSEEGKAGTESRATNKMYSVAGSKNNSDPHIASRAAALQDAATFGMIAVLSGGDPNAPTAPWGRDDSHGLDALSARGNMWGAELGEAGGAGGLGLTGIGDGGGGRFEGIGMGPIGTIGHGNGPGDGSGFGPGFGRSGGLAARAHKPKSPSMRVGSTTMSGRLPAEVIQRIVRQNFGRFRLCYENGLRNNPSLQGRVEVRFIIGRDGAVSNVGNGASDLPDSAVVSCVVRAFYGLSFPQPEDGIVKVGYPIMFSPGG